MSFPTLGRSETGDGVSSRMTDVASEGESPRSATFAPRMPTHHGATGSGGAGDNNAASSRPSTAKTTSTGPFGGTTSQPSTTAPRRTQKPTSKRSSMVGGARNSMAGANRPQSAVGGRPQSATSRTHVPSVASNAFFRPMSSQRLQAQRGAAMRQPASAHGPSLSNDHHIDEAATDTNRQSLGSTATRRPAGWGFPFPYDEQPPPPSRGTDGTDRARDDRPTSTSPTGNLTLASYGESVAPLNAQAAGTAARGLTVDVDRSRQHRTTSLKSPTQPSPKTFRSSFLLPSRGTGQTRESTAGREKLPSIASSPRDPPDKMMEELRITSGKNYQYFTGNTIFCWGGRLQNTRDRPVNILTGLFVIAPAILFLIFSASYLWYNASPAIPIVFGYIFFVCISSFIHASVCDPGILPRNLHCFPPSPDDEDPLTVGPPLSAWTVIKSFTPQHAAMDVPVKYCKTCNIWRPPRSHHCRVCDNCVETQDHHCVWLNNCVGRRNYRYFFTFVATGSLLGIFLIGASLAHILIYRSTEHTTFGTAIDHLRVPFAMVIFGLIVTPYPVALFVYHLYLMSRAESTREYLFSHKFAKSERHRPYSHGNMLKNLVNVLGRPRPPTYLHFKQAYEAGDQRFGTDRTKHGGRGGGTRPKPPKDGAGAGNLQGNEHQPVPVAHDGGEMEMRPMESSAPAFQRRNTGEARAT